MTKKHIVILLETFSLMQTKTLDPKVWGAKIASISALCMDIETQTLISQFEVKIDHLEDSTLLRPMLKRQFGKAWQFQHESGIGKHNALTQLNTWLESQGEGVTLWCAIDEIDQHLQGRETALLGVPSSSHLERIFCELDGLSELLEQAHMISCVGFDSQTLSPSAKLKKQVQHTASILEVAQALQGK